MSDKSNNKLSDQDRLMSNLRQKILLTQITAIAALIIGVGSVLGLAFVLNNTESIDKTNTKISSLQQSINDLKKNDIVSNGVKYSGEAGKSALDILENKHVVETKDFGSLGKMVTSIDGVAAGDGQFWAFYVNGEIAAEGASTYQTSYEDTIQWRLETIQ